MKRTRGPVTTPGALVLTFRGLDLCDGCGTRLDPKERLWGLCPACQAKDRIQPQSRRTRRGVMAGRRPKGDRA